MTTAPRTALSTRLTSIALAALLTVVTLTGVNTLALAEGAAPQLAQAANTQV